MTHLLELHDGPAAARQAAAAIDPRFQMEPPLAGASASVPLTDVQDCVLALIELDPRLIYGNRRTLLRLLAELFHSRFADHRRVGRALRRLREHAESGLVRTRAFAPRPRCALTGEPQSWADPDGFIARAGVEALLDRYGGDGRPHDEAIAAALRYFGVRADAMAR